MRRSTMVNALLPLLHALVVVVAIGVAVAATSPREAVMQSAPSTSKHGVDSAQMQAIAAEGGSVHSNTTEEMVSSMGNGGHKRSSDREAVKNHKELCGASTNTTNTSASRYRSTHSRFCSVDAGTRSTRNLRGSRTDIDHNNGHSRHHRDNGKVLESVVKSPNKDGKKRKRFLRWAGDDNQEMIEGNDSRTVEEAHRDMSAAALAVGTVADRHLRTSREGVATVGDEERSDGVREVDEKRKSARLVQGVDLDQSLRGRRA